MKIISKYRIAALKVGRGDTADGGAARVVVFTNPRHFEWTFVNVIL
jgi:hypothetical protein